MSKAEIYYIYLLKPGAKPRKSPPLLFQEVNKHRWLDCLCYSECLHFVSRSPWKGFSCDRCPNSHLTDRDKRDPTLQQSTG